ncbi:Cellobiose 2-epimerase [Planctomycetes bacterium Poly30]|uniref:Cellobiose 2-epimerase n=1 Tax=Saltatorellus ferox TaxID=2528018 RepID=A0A518ERP6_9BACT|nr:Cellobiose 2-epimerase [Planctomycetes bacterium Poly30]
MEHSLDEAHGGFLNCLDRDGTPFDTTKHVWLQGRQVWMLSKVFLERRDERYLDAARLGVEFLGRHAVGSDGRAYFALRRDGAPIALQRKIFSECFLVMAYAEFARASGDQSYRARALDLFDTILGLIEDPTRLGRPVLSGQTKTSELAVPMILLNLVAELRGEPGSETFDDREDYDRIEAECVAKVLRHFDAERGLVFETVGAGGERLLDSPAGRLLNPGHVIEAAWFLVQYAERVNDSALVDSSLAMMKGALDVGWDTEHGGLYYFLDSEGYSPTQLEWSMKLWWPHLEAMVGTLVAWRASSDARWFERFEQVASWAYERFPDPEHGEWFGYLDREGRVSQRFKGGPYKGCFHVPRALMLCERLLKT